MLNKKYRGLVMTMLLLLLAFPMNSLAQGKTVVTSFYPIYIFTKNVLKDIPDVTLSVLAPPSNGCLHDYQLLTSDMKMLATADLFVINGAGMEPYLHTLEEQMPDLKMLDCSAGVELIANENDGEAHEEQGEGHHHDDEHNSHIWLSPINAMIMVDHIAGALGDLVPDHAAAIQSNADAYKKTLADLHEEIQDGLKGITNRKIVTFHEAFPYFAKAYGLEVVAVINTEPDHSMPPAHLAEISDKVRKAGSPPLFTEPQYQDHVARIISAETGAKIYVLDPLASGTDTPDAYETVMRQNLMVLKQALAN